MAFRSDYLWVESLEPYYQRLPREWIEPLVINQAQIEISPWKQLLSRYHGRPLIYPNTPQGLEDAGTRFTEIFFDNQFLLKQIKKRDELITELCNFDNWQTVTHSITASNQDTSSSGASYGKGNIKDTQNTTLGTKTGQSDGNSYYQARVMEDGFPINLFSESNTTNRDIRSNENDSANISKGASKLTAQGIAKVGVSNTSEDIRNFLNVQWPDHRKLFWAKFEELFGY